MTALTFVLPGRPRSWARARAHGKRRFEAPEQSAHKEALRLAASRAAREQGVELPLRFPIALHVTAVFRRPARRPKGYPIEFWEMDEPPARVNSDADNLAKMVADALQGLVYANDREIVEVYCHRVYGPTARTEVVVVEIEP